MSGIGTLERVPLRDVWQHEAHDFTRWLEESIEVLNEVIETEVVTVAREQAVGPFSVDLLAEDSSGSYVVIENQLERSDHDHLGKLLTYATAYEARTAVWIVSDPRPEHINVITWLNETTPTSFYLFKVEAVRIDESRPAPLLTRIIGPSEESRDVGETKRETAERDILRRKFWTGLLDAANKRTPLHSSISPGHDNWIGTGAGIGGLSFNYVVLQRNARVELYIDRGNQEENKQIYDQLVASQPAIEEEFGDQLYWQRLEGKRACRVSYAVSQGGYRDDESSWNRTYDAMIVAMINLERVLRPYINNIRI